ncbi:hypothetical protein JCM11641_007077 [Rhodosporidiobolus odoratus]
MSTPTPRQRSQVGLVYLDSLDASTARHELSEAGKQIGLAARQGRDIARRDLRDAWDGLDRRIEASSVLGRGPNGGLMDVTQLAPSPQYASSSTANLRKGISVHGNFSRKYLHYAEQDAENALHQAGMAAGEAVEVGRRGLTDWLREGKPYLDSPTPPTVLKPTSLSSSSASPADPLKDYLAHRDRSRGIAEGLMDAAGMALDVGIGMGVGELAERRKREMEAAGLR